MVFLIRKFCPLVCTQFFGTVQKVNIAVFDHFGKIFLCVMYISGYFFLNGLQARMCGPVIIDEERKRNKPGCYNKQVNVF